MSNTPERTALGGWKRATSAMALAIGAGFGFGFAEDARAVVTPDTVPPDQAVDVNDDRPYLVGLGVRNEAGNGGGTCSGLLINPRTVLFAAHCVDSIDPGDYDANLPGNRAQVGYTTDPTFGNTNLREWLFGQDFIVPPGDERVIDASSVMVWYDPRSRFGPLADPNGGTFLPADIAIAGFDTPTESLGRDAQDGVGLLFSPVDRLVAVTIGGYGQAGNGLTGARLAGSEATFFRRVASNMLGYLGDERSISAGVYPSAVADLLDPPTLNYQDLYWVDFDDPQRATRPFFAGPGVNPNSTLDFDVFPGDAVPGEAITAAGDSGSPLITDAFGRDVSLGVLSLGARFFHDSVGNPNDNFVRFTAFSNFGTTAGYNPLFLFWDQIVINNPYKYVQARAGNREWTDPDAWVQELDPLFYSFDAQGNLVNALPTTPALGRSDAAANVGELRPNPASPAACAFTGTCPATGGTDDPIVQSTALPGMETMAGVETLNGGPHAPTGPSTAPWADGTLLQFGTGALTGPGTTGFVPDNTNGTPGIQNTTRFFEVNLRNGGRVTLRDADVEIDRLNIRGIGAELRIRETGALTTTLSSFLDYGRLTVDGAFNPRAFDIFLGIVSGKGTITAPGGVANYAGIVSPGGDDIGTLTINGDYAQGGYASVLFQIGRHTTDLLRVGGDVTMAGNLLVQSDRRLRFGNRFTVVEGQSITGNFDRTLGSGTLLFGRTVADADSIDLVIDAQKLSDIFGGGSLWGSLAVALDSARKSGASYTALAGVYDVIDYVGIDALGSALPTLAPMNAFQSMPLAVQYAQGFTRGFDARAAELRAGVRGMSQRSLNAGLRMAQAGGGAGGDASGFSRSAAAPVDPEARLGFFVSGQGNLSAIGDEAYAEDRFNPAMLTSASAADMTVGADYRVNDHFALGVATTISRYLARNGEEGVTLQRHSGYGAMLYGSAWNGGWHVDSYFGVAHHAYEVSRAGGAGFDRSLDAAPGATQMLAGVTAGWTFDPLEGLSLGPSLSVRHASLRMDGYREQGAGDLALEVDARRIDSTTVETAMEFAYRPFRSDGPSPLQAWGRAGFVQDLGDGRDVVLARFVAAPDVAFSIDRNLKDAWGTVSSGLLYQFSDTMAGHFEAVSDIGRGPLSNTSIQVGLNWQF